MSAPEIRFDATATSIRHDWGFGSGHGFELRVSPQHPLWGEDEEASSVEVKIDVSGLRTPMGAEAAARFVLALFRPEVREAIGAMVPDITGDVVSFNIVDPVFAPFAPAPEGVCAHCGQPAVCLGRYDAMHSYELACSTCCGHGNEDGHCESLEDLSHAAYEQLLSRVPEECVCDACCAERPA